ncbi:MAG TPA: 7TM diverse intracellular signaling domain-containing protein [Leptospiraceae bacterium]|nr:7TM diverse intracellular signaling domain-containing protein [Leptospiraceae bacterium]HNE53309.1 7TM diverse intracellular signaling domain-containing protein [Leptospiraceae bacterium]HNH57060.1 7TM diverse intracellular signaling domain-containing protein [Leptospiraceae bacterium]HNL72940.1 7TM diverse intracellular signaling domain-containing protein [Leptospiraceae bacterium]HNN80140.1 7TM diverse intracellular signaling domain-containing protein [Leptospiraceae bacterium]
MLFFIDCRPSNTTKIYSLSGEWQYKTGFDIDWLSEKSDDPSWKKIKLPTNLSRELNLNSYTGYITLRKEIPHELDSRIKEGTSIAINAGRVLDVSYYYFNTTLFGQLGSASPYKPGAMRPFIKDIPNKNLSDTLNRITVVLYTENGKFPLQFMDSIEIGEADDIYLAYTRKEIFAFIFLSAYFVVGLYHILLASKRPKDIYNLYFGLFCLFASIYWFIANTFSRDILFQDSVVLHRKLEHVFLFALPPTLLVFLVQFFEKRYGRFALGLTALSGTFIVLSLIFPLPVMRFCAMLWQISNIVVCSYSIYFLYKHIKKGNKDGLYLIFGMLVFGLSIGLDMATSRNFIHLPALSNFAFLLFVMGIAAIMANRFMKVTNEVEELNADLEMKVEDRTKKLSESLDQVNKLKEQQDGDYYLTSLLLQPLSGNFIKTKETEFVTESLVKQKKQFQFRKKTSEIGGDICIVDEIELEGLSFTVFLNADAMGKSIQGAGGCLVLGTVFKSILERNHSNADNRNMPPEHWMKEVFRELQNVFISFNGSMLISAMFGIIDNRNGTMYYINAEHPFSVLYRDRKASFIDEENVKRKIGIEVKESPLRIQLFQLKEGDQLISGSDGRDDILLSVDESGVRVINENEKLFLQIVEEADGDLIEIEKVLKQKGEITDDLSLLKITYQKKESESSSSLSLEDIDKNLSEAYKCYTNGQIGKALSIYQAIFRHRKDPNLVLEITNLFIEKREYSLASRFLDIYNKQNPYNSYAIYLNSFVKKKNKEYEIAAQLGERFRLREPTNVKNLVNLADIYRLLNKMELTRKYLSRALKLDPNNKQALKLEESLVLDSTISV